MALELEGDNFHCSGPLHLTSVNWKNTDHRTSVVASLVNGVYILEQDRRKGRQGSHCLAPHWWNFFGFHLHSKLIDDKSRIFGAIYEYEPPQPTDEIPRYVIAFRGTLITTKDIKQDLRIILNKLHRASRFQIAIQAVQEIARNSPTVWLAGHSLGSAMAMLAGKHMAKMGTFLEAFLFNPPFVSIPIDLMNQEKVKHGVRILLSVVTAGLATAVKVKHHNKNGSNEEPFVALKEWVPRLFVNSCDYICRGYIGYFRHRKWMEKIGLGGIERLASQHSIASLLDSVIRNESIEPFHLIPSATLTVNLSPSCKFRRDHSICQWWSSNLNLESTIYENL